MTLQYVDLEKGSSSIYNSTKSKNQEPKNHSGNFREKPVGHFFTRKTQN
jgi:hypothetical protein